MTAVNETKNETRDFEADVSNRLGDHTVQSGLSFGKTNRAQRHNFHLPLACS